MGQEVVEIVAEDLNGYGKTRGSSGQGWGRRMSEVRHWIRDEGSSGQGQAMARDGWGQG